jgi:hypothetical protein
MRSEHLTESPLAALFSSGIQMKKEDEFMAQLHKVARRGESGIVPARPTWQERTYEEEMFHCQLLWCMSVTFYGVAGR